MLNLSRLFGKSPFTPLQAHMTKVSDCVEKLNEIFTSLNEGDFTSVEDIAQKISELEHDADVTKNHIRDHLRKSLFLAVDRQQILEILAIQDSIADRAEDVGMLLTLRRTEMLDVFKAQFSEFLKKNIEAFHGARDVIYEMEQLLQSSFGGVEAEKVRHMVDHVAFIEHEVDLLQRKLLRILFQEADQLPSWKFILWKQILGEVAGISNLSEKLVFRMRMTLEAK